MEVIVPVVMIQHRFLAALVILPELVPMLLGPLESHRATILRLVTMLLGP
jgi:hypothetical protein